MGGIERKKKREREAMKKHMVAERKFFATSRIECKIITNSILSIDNHDSVCNEFEEFQNVHSVLRHT